MRRLLRSLKGRRSFAASNFREVVKLAISRIAGLKEERSNKCSANLQSIQVFIPYDPHPSALNLALHRVHFSLNSLSLFLYLSFLIYIYIKEIISFLTSGFNNFKITYLGHQLLQVGVAHSMISVQL